MSTAPAELFRSRESVITACQLIGAASAAHNLGMAANADASLLEALSVEPNILLVIDYLLRGKKADRSTRAACKWAAQRIPHLSAERSA